MDALTISAASGMRARMESLEMLANNIANQATAGYKSDREFYNLYFAPEAIEAGAPRPTLLPVIESHWTDFSQGALTATGNPTDLAIAGEGFFTVQGPSGPLYTRNGSLQLSPQGRLETETGYAVLDRSGNPIQVDPARSFEVGEDGTLTQEGVSVAELAVVEFASPESLAKHAGCYFRQTNASETPARAASARVHQATLEGANFSPAEAAVRLVEVMRQFEMLHRAVSVGSEMGRRAAEEVARVGS